jgi:hypothetical protein
VFSIGFHTKPDFFRRQLNSYTKNPISSGVFVIMTAKKVVVVIGVAVAVVAVTTAGAGAVAVVVE